MPEITCQDCEILFADYLDQALEPGQKSSVEQHVQSCVACDQMLRDCSSAMGVLAHFRETAAPMAPLALVNQILRATTDKPAQAPVSLVKNLAGNWFKTLQESGTWLWQPRVVMGLAMSALSLVMVVRFWDAAENNAYRAWNRTMKHYENLALVYDVQNQLDQWTDVNPGDRKP